MRDLMADDDKTVFLPVSQAEKNLTATPNNVPVVSQVQPSAFGGLANKNIKKTEASFIAEPVTIKPLAMAGADQNILSALQLNYRSGVNIVIEHATELFFAHYQIIKGRFSDTEKIRAFVQDALLKFEMRSQQSNLAKALVKSAKYVLCTFLDEAVLQTDWGRESSWSHQSLLAQYFNETWGGATVFKIRQFCLENIHEYIDLLEMIYICLCLGFKGQYGTEPNGDTLLDRIKRETYQAIADYRGDKLNLPLSPHGASDYQGAVTLKKERSLKWLAASCVAILVIAYVSMSAFISIESAPVYDKIVSMAGN